MNRQVCPADRPARGVIRGVNVRRLLPLAIMVVLAGCAASNGESSSASSPTEVPQVSPTSSSVASPSEAAPSSSPAATITVNGLAKSTVDGLAVRANAGTAGTQLGTIDSGALGF